MLILLNIYNIDKSICSHMGFLITIIRHVNSSSFGKICRFEIKMGHERDLCRFDEKFYEVVVEVVGV